MDIASIKDLISSYGLIILFIGNILDHSGIPVFMLVAGGLVAINHQSMVDVILVSISSVFLGDLLFYSIGRVIDPSRLHVILRVPLLQKTAQKLQVRINKTPISFILAGRMVAVVGKYVPLLFGVSRFKLWRFMFWDLLGSIAYSIVFLILGFLGSSLINDNFSMIQKSFILACCILIYFVYQKTPISSLGSELKSNQKKSLLDSLKQYNKRDS